MSTTLEERTARFGESAIALVKQAPVNVITTPIISQLVRAATSVGGNYCEADEAESRKEFRYRIGICKRESREVKHQVRMLVAAVPALREDGRVLWQEAKELTRIFAAILRRGRVGASSLVGHWGLAIGALIRSTRQHEQ